MAKSQKAKAELEPLKVTCTSTDCDNDLHCFLATSEMKKGGEIGACRECGAELVDWSRVHKKDVNDARYTFEAMKLELIRHKFWHVEIDDKALNYSRRRGISGLEDRIRSRIRNSVGKAKPYRDGSQTPWEGSGNPIHYAQHATASCCRKCVEYWHAIPQGRALTEDEIEYLSELALLYIVDRVPGLTEDGEHVPPMRRAK